MRLLPLGLLSVLWFSQSLALHESDVGIVDWHKRLIGVPLSDSISTAPVFHRVGSENTQSIVLTATGNNVLAALNPLNGSVGAILAISRELFAYSIIQFGGMYLKWRIGLLRFINTTLVRWTSLRDMNMLLII